MKGRLPMFDLDAQDKWGLPQGNILSFCGQLPASSVDFSRLARATIDLIKNGTGIDRLYDGDQSRAIYRVCHEMARARFTDLEIASVLTDRANFLGSVSYEHAKTSDRNKAAAWIINQNMKKVRDIISQEVRFAGAVVVHKAGGEEANRRLRLNFEDFKDIEFDSQSSALIEDFIDHGSAVIIYGDANSGKTFFALDLAFHVAQNKEWNGKKVEGGPVLYVAAEGGRKIRNRIVAFREVNGLRGIEIPFRLAIGPIDLLDPRADTPSLIYEIKKLKETAKQPVRLIVIDTLSRALAGGDENTSVDMGLLVKNVDQIRHETGSAVVIIHHTGKNTSKGARGHSLLRAAVDTEIEIADVVENKRTTKDFKAARITKQRDYDYGNDLVFQLIPTEVGRNDAGKTVTSCVVGPVDMSARKAFSRKIYRPTSVVGKGLVVLRDLVARNSSAKGEVKSPSNPTVTKEQWRREFVSKYYSGRVRQTRSDAFKRAVERLVEDRYVEVCGESVCLLD